MKKYVALGLIVVLLMQPLCVLGKEGDSGYEGGISSCQNLASSKTSSEYTYQEVVFLTGTPIILKGKVGIKKKTTADTETNTYTYTLSDTNKNTLKRTVSLQTKITQNNNNQITKETVITGKPTETVVINNKTYTLDTYNLTKTSIVDVKAATQYYAGSIDSKKSYIIDEGTDSINVNLEGQFYGYNHNWSNGEVQILDYIVEGKTSNDSWSGKANIKLSSNSATEFKYMKNYPEEISFDGGFVSSQSISNKLIYKTSMPEFDKDGVSTDRIITKQGNTKIDSFPNDKRLLTFDLSQIRGHWAEEDIKKIYGLGIFDESTSMFIPNQYITRAEFAKALYKLMNYNTETTTKKTKTKTKPSAQYQDVPVKDPYFEYITFVTNKGIMVGYGDGNFYPNELVSKAQMVQTFVKMLGLEGMSKDEYPVTTFKDNDSIPRWALRSVYVANKIGVVKGDSGYYMPNAYITKAEAATALSRVIQYMSKDMAKSYSDKILKY